MAESEESLHTGIDEHADVQLRELQARVEQARAQIDRAAERLVGAPGVDAPAPAKSEPAPFVIEPDPAPPEADSPGASFAEHLARRVPQTPVVRDAPDFGDIAANIATDDDWKAE